MTVRELVVVVVVIAVVGAVMFSVGQWAWEKRLYRELCEAARDGDSDEVKQLLSRGADVKIRDNDGKTPLQLAEDEGHADIVALLKQHGARE